MKPTRIRTTAVTITAALTSVAAAVMAPTAIAGGSGDFYKHYACSINSSGTASLDVTNYDIATGQRYHMDMDAPSGYYPMGLYVDGVKQAGWNDRYKDFANRSSTHTIKGVWYRGDPVFANAVACSLKF